VRIVSTWTLLPRRWIGRASGNDQPLLLSPPRFPDITPCDFFSLVICQRWGICICICICICLTIAT
jgi:hypothetical protein